MENAGFEKDALDEKELSNGFHSDTSKGGSRDHDKQAHAHDDNHFTVSPSDVTSEKRRILKNIVLVSLAFLMNFTAFQGLSRLQSSLHRVEGMGVVNLSVLYGALVLSCLFVPKLLIRTIGHKWTIPLSFLGYILWMAANGYAVWGTMVTASILVGLAAAPLWTAQCSYFTKLAGRYAALSGETDAAVVSRFFGIFFMFFQFSGITGSIITATTLMPSEASNDSLSAGEIRLYCGMNDCPENNVTYNSNLERPDSRTVWTMVGIFIGLAIGGALIVTAFVDRLPRSLRDDKGDTRRLIKDSLLATVKHLRVPEQCVLIPITMYSGFEQAFYGAEWTGSFISCSLGIWKIGLVTLAYGVVNTLVSLITGHIVKYTGRVPIFTLGMLIDLSIQFTLIFWPLDRDKEIVFYVISGLWGFTDAIWQTQINALYGSLFADNAEAAFSNYRMWESLGFIIAFAYSAFLCTRFKLYILMAVLMLGMLGYYTVEAMDRSAGVKDVVISNPQNGGQHARQMTSSGAMADVATHSGGDGAIDNAGKYVQTVSRL